MAHVNFLVIRVPELPLNFPHCARRHAKLDYDLLDSLTCLEPLTYAIRKRHVIFKLPRYNRPMSPLRILDLDLGRPISTVALPQGRVLSEEQSDSSPTGTSVSLFNAPAQNWLFPLHVLF